MKNMSVIILVLLLSFTLFACGDQEADSDQDGASQEAEQLAEQADELAELAEEADNAGAPVYAWPSEADQFDVPELKKGNIVGLTINNQAVAVGFEGVTRDDIEAYKELLLSKGFAESTEYPGGAMWAYGKNGSSGAVEVTIAFTADHGAASIVINPKDGKVELSGQSSSSDLAWPDSMPKGVPEFKKGKIINITDNTGIATVEYEGVKQSDVDAYKKALIDAGFMFDTEDSSDSSLQFEKTDEEKMSVTIVSVDYDGKYMSISAAGI